MSSDTPRAAGRLEIDQDLAFQHRSWALQRRLWIGMAVFLALGLLDRFGPGPFSRATVGDAAGPLRLEYQRFERHRAGTTLRADLRPGPGPPREARLWLGRDYLDGVEIVRIDPVPLRVEAAPERSAYVFLLLDPGQSTRVTIHLRPARRGRLHGRISLDEAPSLAFAQFVYP